MTEHTPKEKYLVVDDYGSGGIWFVLLADSEAQIHERLGDVKVYSPGVKSEWMPDQDTRGHCSAEHLRHRRAPRVGPGWIGSA